MTLHYLAITCLGFYLAAALLFLLEVVRGYKTAIRPRLLLLVGFILHSALIVPFLSSSKDMVPESRGEYLFWLSWGLPFLYFVGRRKVDFPVIGAFVAPLSALFFTGSSYLSHLSSPERSDVEGSSILLVFHVAPALVAELCLVIAFILSCVFLVQDKRLKHRKTASLALGGPNLETLETLNERALSVGFISMTFAILTGTLWAFSEHVSLFGKDFYQWLAILVWIFLGLLLHVRLNMHWSARKLSRMTVYVTGAVLTTIIVMIVFLGNAIHVGYRF